MFEASAALFLYAETSLHPGSGQSVGAIDLAIQRERYTGYPMVASTGIKGVVRDRFERSHGKEAPQVLAAFGPGADNADKHAGATAFTDARILLFPVRSMKGVFAWTTCPAVLGRLQRDLTAAGVPTNRLGLQTMPRPKAGQVLGALSAGDHACVMTKEEREEVLLEELACPYQQDGRVGEVAKWLKGHALPQHPAYDYWRDRLRTNLLVLHDDDFGDFVRHATEVQARVKLNDQKTTGEDGNLFYQENLPSDTLLYSLAFANRDLRPPARNGAADAEESKRFSAQELLNFIAELNGTRVQIGGDESVGKGIVCVQMVGGGAATGQMQAGVAEAAGA